MASKINGDRLRLYRRTLGFSLSGAARRLGVTPTHLMLWEKGAVMPKGKHLIKLEALYHRLISDIYFEIRQEALTELEETKRLYGEFGTGKPP
jgi:transcriptional regulator with XRE-family HTH domain